MRQPIFDFSTYVDDRTRDFTRREWVFAEIDRWLADPDAPLFFVITGEPGIGKTAIAARLTQVRDLAAVVALGFKGRDAEGVGPGEWGGRYVHRQGTYDHVRRRCGRGHHRRGHGFGPGAPSAT